jgi:hypothetical protein
LEVFYGTQRNYDSQKWDRIVDSNFSLFWARSFEFEHDVSILNELIDKGIKVNYRLNWWDLIEFHRKSVVDFYIDTTSLVEISQFVDDELNEVNTEKLWAVTLSEGEPWRSFGGFGNEENWNKYQEVYQEETGFLLKSNRNATEERVLNEWMGQKMVWFFNYLYDYIKNKWPHIKVFQVIELTPGVPNLGIDDYDQSGLKSDRFMGQVFASIYSEQPMHPFWTYNYVRTRKSTNPNLNYQHWVTTDDMWVEFEDETSHPDYEQILEVVAEQTWLAFLGGSESIGYDVGGLLDRNDAVAKMQFLYLDRLNTELEKLNPFKPKPKVLLIQQYTHFRSGGIVELGLFNEWDTVNQYRFSSRGFDLSNYDLIIVDEERFLDSTVTKLNSYVKSGGNLIVTGSFRDDNIFENGTRIKFLFEEGVDKYWSWDNMKYQLQKPNLLNTEINLERTGFESMIIQNNSLSVHHQLIGDLYSKDENGTYVKFDGSPLLFYQNKGNPVEGWIFFNGIERISSEHLDLFDWNDPIDWQETISMQRFIDRSFLEQFEASLVSSSQTEEMIISPAKLSNDTILLGLISHDSAPQTIFYNLDLQKFGFQSGKYFIGSPDGTIDQQQSIGLSLPITITINPQEALLLTISTSNEQQLDINMKPDYPNLEDIEGMWPVQEPLEETFGPVLALTGILLSVAVVIAYFRDRRKY